MEVKFNPLPEEEGSGLSAFASWDNDHLLRALVSVFGVRSNELIDSIEVTKDGITARLSYTKKQHKHGGKQF